MGPMAVAWLRWSRAAICSDGLNRPAATQPALEPEPAERHLHTQAMNHRPSLILFLVAVVSGGLAIGYLTAPGEWYAQLTKPGFNPPAWVFGPAWTVLYVLIAVAGWRVWRREPGGWPMRLWWAQMVLNFSWSPVFFSAHRIGLALIVVLLLLAAILAFIATVWRRDRVAAWLFAPYAAWVAFASLLNASILRLN
jgi:tryptophan-rich sensory protein